MFYLFLELQLALGQEGGVEDTAEKHLILFPTHEELCGGVVSHSDTEPCHLHIFTVQRVQSTPSSSEDTVS